MTGLQERRAEAESRLASLRQARGRALLDGAEFSDVEIAQAEAQIAAIGEAEAEAVRRQRAADANQQTRTRQQLHAELVDKSAARLVCIAAAEKALREYVDRINDVIEIAEAERALIRQLGGQVPDGLTPFELPARLSSLAAPVLARIKGHPHHFGGLKWHFVGQHDRSWTDLERRTVVTDI